MHALRELGNGLPAVRNISCPSSAGFLEPETGACSKHDADKIEIIILKIYLFAFLEGWRLLM